jgi:NADH dehydrogenase (ubiquinone) flavoprotein 2
VSAAAPSAAAGFAFTPENEAAAKAIVARYPAGRQASAVLGLLTLAQEQCGSWLPQPALDYVADYLALPRIRVYEVASFYDMFNTRPVGRTQIRVCTTTPCWLCGSDAVLAACKDALGIEVGQSTADGRFFLREFECLGACANAPVLWIDDDYYEDLTYESATAVIESVQRGERPRPGSQAGRQASMAARGKTTLLADPHRDGGTGRKSGRGDPDQEPVDKGRPDERVKGHAVKVEREGRPAEGVGGDNLAEPKDPDAR